MIYGRTPPFALFHAEKLDGQRRSVKVLALSPARPCGKSSTARTFRPNNADKWHSLAQLRDSLRHGRGTSATFLIHGRLARAF
jgi:hypothetical protein